MSTAYAAPIETIAWHCGFEDGCTHGWHKATYWSTDKGYTLDEFSDGDHDDVDEVPSCDEVVKSWKEYADDCYQTGEDPLNNYFAHRVAKSEHTWQAWFRLSIAGAVLVGVRRRGRGRWLQPGRDAVPNAVFDYLLVSKSPTLYTFREEGITTARGHYDKLRELAESDPDVKVQRARGLKFTFTVTEKRERSDAAYRRDLRAIIRGQRCAS